MERDNVQYMVDRGGGAHVERGSGIQVDIGGKIEVHWIREW